jgi:protocatechuate 3,4-dioxygenase beta subunit
MNRRFLLSLGGGAVALGSLGYWQRNPIARWALSSRVNDVAPTFVAAAGTDVCVLMPEQTEGPYYLQSPLRSSIAENRRGIPFSLTIQVVSLPDCAPLEGATVEIWHCDAKGAYSGYGNNLARAPFDATLAILKAGGPDAHIKPIEDTMYLRGGQISDAQGEVRFETIFPGWYEPRVAHIHLKVSRDGQSYLTTQLYFPDELSAEIYGSHPDYVMYGQCPYNMTNDLVLGDFNSGAGMVLRPDRGPQQISASARVGIA